MIAKTVIATILLSGLAAFAEEPGFHQFGFTEQQDTKIRPGGRWRVHDETRPLPPRVLPPAYAGEQGALPPSDAIPLFNGTTLDAFANCSWTIKDGVATMPGSKGTVDTRQEFGSCQLHAEFRIPPPLPRQPTSNMGNSGFLFMGQYEVQVFDSYSCRIYADGSSGAIYGQTPPLVNVSRKPGEWQSIDIVFEAPGFEEGKLVKPAFITAFLNGVLIQNHVEIEGPTSGQSLPYKAHPAKMPLRIQGHGSAISFRNIWIRELVEGQKF